MVRRGIQERNNGGNLMITIQVHWKCQGKTSQGLLTLTYAGFGLVHVVGSSCAGNTFWDTMRPAADLVEIEQTLRKNGGDITEVAL